MSAWGNLKAELTCAQLMVLTTVEKVLDLSRKTIVFRNELLEGLTSVAG